MSNFDWLSEEESGWEPEPERPQPPRPPRRVPWLTLIVLCGIVGGVVWFAYQQIQARIEATTSLVEADILASHDLVLAAVAAGDDELLRTVLSGRDDAWVEVQQELAAENAWLDRDALAMHLLPEPAGAPDLNLSPQFDEAELQFALDYAVLDGNGVTQTVTLSQTAVYRRGAQRWLLAPPEDAFWGTLNSSAGRYVTLHFWDRDELWAERLAGDLERVVLGLCTRVDGISCEDDLNINVRLDRDAATMALLVDPTYAWQRTDLILDLPSLTLIGKPVDEAGYEAIAAAYSRQVAAAVITHLADYTCCENASFYQALLDYQLSQIGLGTWPVTEADFTRIYVERPELNQFINGWRNSDLAQLEGEDAWLVYAAIEFLIRGRHLQFGSSTPISTTALSLQAAMAPGQGFLTWLGRQFRPGDAASLTNAWNTLTQELWQYAYLQTLVTDAVAARPFPEEHVALVCQGGRAGNFESFVLYDVEMPVGDDTSVRTLELPGFAYVSRIGHDDGLFVSVFDETPDYWRTSIWRAGEQRVLSMTDYLLVSLGQTNPDASRIVVYTTVPGAEETIRLALLDPAQCDGERCDLTYLAGMPSWSPDGARAMLAELDVDYLFSTIVPFADRWVMLDTDIGGPEDWTSRLWLADGEGQLLDPDAEGWIGYAPFWKDDDTFGFVQANADGQAVMLGSAEGGRLETAVTLADLAPHVPAPQPGSESLAIHYAVAHPAHPDLLFVILFDTREQNSFVMQYNLRSKETRFLVQASYQFYHSLSLSPDGRWLLLAGNNADLPEGSGEEAPVPETILYRLDDDLTRRYLQETTSYFLWFTNYDWSANGEWLLLNLGPNFPTALIAPDDDYVYLPPLAIGECVAGMWIGS